MNRYEFYGNINTYRRNQTNKENELTHYGTLGQKWGVRKWQNPDGTFNEAGKERYFGTGKFEPVSKDEGKKSETKLSSKAADIYKNYKPNEWNIGLNKSNLSSKEWYKLKTEMNNKLYSEDKKFSKIINDKDVQSAMQDYINARNEVNEEEKRVFSEEFRNSNPKARDFDGDGWEYWHEFADPNIIRKDDETYKNLKEAISKKSTKNIGFTSDLDTMNKVVSDIKEACERGKDSDKIYDLVKENTGVDLRNNEEKIGSNPDKKAIKEGKKLEKELVKSMNKSWEEREKLQDKIINDPKYKEVFDNLTKSNNEKLAKEYSRLNEIFDDYEKNEIENVAKGGIASWMLDGNTKMGDLGRGAWLYLFEDLNQGYANAESLYTRYEKNIDKKEIDYLYDKLHNNKDLHKENIQYLKDNNKALSQINDSQLLMLVRKNEGNNPNNKTGAYWDLYNAADDSVQNGNKERDAYKEAKKVAQKLNKSCGNDDNGWNWLNKAIENLGMDDIDYEDMTQADWDKLNAEVNRLKK